MAGDYMHIKLELWGAFPMSMYMYTIRMKTKLKVNFINNRH